MSVIRRAGSVALALVLAGGAIVLACNTDDIAVTSPGGSGGPTRVVEAGTFREPTPPCEEAVAGQACPNDPTVCEIGDHPNPACNARLGCRGVAWKLDRDAAACATACPAAFDLDPPPPDACAIPNASSLRCEYDDERTTCGCARAEADAGGSADAGDAGDGDAGDAGDAGAGDAGRPAYVWTCVLAPEGCPSIRPHVGAPCVLPMTCDYGQCVFDERPAMRCIGGFWDLETDARCPPQR